jgi:hypothetical protein
VASLLDPAKIAALKNQFRGANSRVNKIAYWLEQATRSGEDVAAVLSQALDANGYSSEAKQLTLLNLTQNWQSARAVGAFTPDNLKRMRTGMSAILSNGVKLDVDHIVPVNLAPEVGTTLANLLLTPHPPNRALQDVVTESVVAYAQKLNQAQLLSGPSLNKIESAVRYVRR